MKEICAKNAKELTDYFAISNIKNELRSVFESINKAIRSGKYYCDIYVYISNETKDKLKELGYVIEDFYNQKDGYDYKINWSN